MLNRRCRRLCFGVVMATVTLQIFTGVLNSISSNIPHWISVISWSLGDFYDMTDDFGPDEPAASFLVRYKDYCEQSFFSNASNVEASVGGNGQSGYNSSELCDCVPSSLVGAFPVNYIATPSLEFITSIHPELKPGGLWLPSKCIPRQRVAVIIPFRAREEHLKALLYVLHPMLQRQKLNYTIFVVEQAEPAVFNKAMLMNAGFREASQLGAFDCFIFHDVDMLPEDDRNFYTCSTVPRHVGAYVDKFNYKIPYSGIFGGVTAFTQTQFELVNGFSNQFYGWGGEDDDMFKRIKAKNLSITRFPRSVARFNMIRHKSDDGNPYNSQSALGFRFRPDHYTADGLNSLIYTKKSAELRPLYYWLLISLPSLPKNFKGYNRRTYRAVRGNGNSIRIAVTSYWSVVAFSIISSLFAIC